MTVVMTGCSLIPKNSPTIDVPASATPSASPSVTAETLGTTDATALTSSFIQEAQLVNQTALQWHSDALLYAVSVSFPSDLQSGHSKRVYVYGSAQDATNWWVLSVNEQTQNRIRSLVPKSDYLGPTLSPVPLQYWKINAVQALQAAEKTGGTSFRQANPGTEITASLAVQGPNNWLWWVVDYRGSGSDELKVRVHPGTGDIYGESGQLVQGSSTTTSTTTASPSATPSATTSYDSTTTTTDTTTYDSSNDYSTSTDYSSTTY